MLKHNKQRDKARNWVVLIFTSMVIIAMLAFVFKRPLIYYAKKVYHEFDSPKSLKLIEASNMKTNLYSEIAVPKGEVYGIDISRHQGIINWKALSEFKFKYNKIDFVYVKATESDSWVDNRFERNWESAKKHKIIRGAYHFFDPEVDAKSQMNLFFDKVKLEKGDLPPMLDVEKESKINTNEYQRLVKQCLIIMENHYRMKPILYVNQEFYSSYFNNEDFEEYSLWISRLKDTPPKQNNWVIWQFSHTVMIPGIDEYVDFNTFRGSMNKFKILLKK